MGIAAATLDTAIATGNTLDADLGRLRRWFAVYGAGFVAFWLLVLTDCTRRGWLPATACRGPGR